jgi:GTPase
VDASDPSLEPHVRTVMKVLEDLELEEIPRLVVLNKIDLVEPARLLLLAREYPDAAMVSATQRESTRPLIDRIARELAGKWERSARGPSVEPEVPAKESPAEDVAPEMTTLDQMLRAVGKRVRSRAV